MFHFKLVFFVLLAIMLQACASLITQPHEHAAGNMIFIHTNPHPGDYAVLDDSRGITSTRWEVLSVTDEGIMVKSRTSIPGKPINLEYQYLVNSNGDVLKAWMQYDDGRRFNLRTG